MKRETKVLGLIPISYNVFAPLEQKVLVTKDLRQHIGEI